MYSTLILYYSIITLSIIIDETWNIYNPRINPKKQYYTIKWEKEAFYPKKIYGNWMLKKYRISDDENKKWARKVYWREVLEIYPKLDKLH